MSLSSFLTNRLKNEQVSHRIYPVIPQCLSPGSWGLTEVGLKLGGRIRRISDSLEQLALGRAAGPGVWSVAADSNLVPFLLGAMIIFD